MRLRRELLKSVRRIVAVLLAFVGLLLLTWELAAWNGTKIGGLASVLSQTVGAAVLFGAYRLWGFRWCKPRKTRKVTVPRRKNPD